MIESNKRQLKGNSILSSPKNFAISPNKSWNLVILLMLEKEN